MLKNLKYIVAVGLVALGSTNDASGGLFGSLSCTAKKGQQGGAAAHQCIEETEPGQNPNFLASFKTFHCQTGNIRPEDKIYCNQVKKLIGEHRESLNTKKQAKAIKRTQAHQKARTLVRSKTESTLNEAKFGKAAKKGQAGSKSSLAKKGSLASGNGKAHSKLGRRNAVSTATALHPAANTPQAIAKRQQRAKARAKAQSLDTLNDAENLRHIVYGEDDQVREEEALARPNLERQKAIFKPRQAQTPLRKDSMPQRHQRRGAVKMDTVPEEMVEEGGVEGETLGDTTFDDEQVQADDASFDAYKGGMGAADDAEEQDDQAQDDDALFNAYNGGAGAADEEQDEQEQGDEELYDQ